jgi:hypothetical protein
MPWPSFGASPLIGAARRAATGHERRLNRVFGDVVIAPRRSNIAHLDRPWHANKIKGLGFRLGLVHKTCQEYASGRRRFSGARGCPVSPVWVTKSQRPAPLERRLRVETGRRSRSHRGLLCAQNGRLAVTVHLSKADRDIDAVFLAITGGFHPFPISVFRRLSPEGVLTRERSMRSSDDLLPAIRDVLWRSWCRA